MSRRFSLKVVLITGAATGIGRATALAFAKEGAALALGDVNLKELERTVSLCKETGAQVSGIKCDVSLAGDNEALVKEAIQKFGGLDVAFNNAGTEGTPGATADCSVESWNKTIGINLTGVYLGMRAQIPAMLKRGKGSIINNASILGTVGFAGAPAYVAAKHGVLGLTKTASLEYSSKGIRVNAVCPGFIETPMLERAGITTNAEMKSSIARMHPIGRMGKAEEIADAVVWLASDQSSFVTGHPLLVDGGFVTQ